METLIHKASGELVNDDPFTVVGKRFKLTAKAIERLGKRPGFTYIVTEADATRNQKCEQWIKYLHLINHNIGEHYIDSPRNFDKRYLQEV